MKTLGTNLDELKSCGIPALFEKIDHYYKMFDGVDDDSEFAMGKNFFVDLGGPILLTETEEDLRQIITAKSSDSKFLSIVDTEDIFDICEYFDNGKYVYILLCTNNGGGTTYLVPRELADRYPTIERSIMLTNVAWGDPDEDYED